MLVFCFRLLHFNCFDFFFLNFRSFRLSLIILFDVHSIILYMSLNDLVFLFSFLVLISPSLSALVCIMPVCISPILIFFLIRNNVFIKLTFSLMFYSVYLWFPRIYFSFCLALSFILPHIKKNSFFLYMVILLLFLS